MMQINIHPATVLDALNDSTPTPLPPACWNSINLLRQLRDEAAHQGARVLVLVWPDDNWTLLAVDVPHGVKINDASELIPNLMANPAALEKMHQNARNGEHLAWLSLVRPAAELH